MNDQLLGCLIQRDGGNTVGGTFLQKFYQGELVPSPFRAPISIFWLIVCAQGGTNRLYDQQLLECSLVQPIRISGLRSLIFPHRGSEFSPAGPPRAHCFYHTGRGTVVQGMGAEYPTPQSHRQCFLRVHGSNVSPWLIQASHHTQASPARTNAPSNWTMATSLSSLQFPFVASSHTILAPKLFAIAVSGFFAIIGAMQM